MLRWQDHHAVRHQGGGGGDPGLGQGERPDREQLRLDCDPVSHRGEQEWAGTEQTYLSYRNVR